MNNPERIRKNCGYPNDSQAYKDCKNQQVNLGLGEALFGF